MLYFCIYYYCCEWVQNQLYYSILNRLIIFCCLLSLWNRKMIACWPHSGSCKEDLSNNVMVCFFLHQNWHIELRWSWWVDLQFQLDADSELQDMKFCLSAFDSLIRHFFMSLADRQIDSNVLLSSWICSGQPLSYMTHVISLQCHPLGPIFMLVRYCVVVDDHLPFRKLKISSLTFSSYESFADVLPLLWSSPSTRIWLTSNLCHPPVYSFFGSVMCI